MELVNRSTLARWRSRKSIPRTYLRQHGKRPCGRRYKYEQEQAWQHSLGLTAALIEEGRRDQRVDYVAVREQLQERIARPAVVEISGQLSEMRADGISADLIATACCRALHLGPRTRRFRRRGEHNLRPFWINEKLKRKYGLTDEQVRDAFRQNPNHRWARQALNEEAADRERTSTICVSKVFSNITRKMASYHRCKDGDLFDAVVEELRYLAGIS
jgi:hypothetical protein